MNFLKTEDIHPDNFLQKTIDIPGNFWGFTIWIDDERAERWCLKTVAQLISPAPGTSQERIKKIEKLVEDTREILFKFFKYPSKDRIDEAVSEVERVFDKTEWAPLFHLPDKKYEVRYWIERNLIEAEYDLKHLIGGH